MSINFTNKDSIAHLGDLLGELAFYLGAAALCELVGESSAIFMITASMGASICKSG